MIGNIKIRLFTLLFIVATVILLGVAQVPEPVYGRFCVSEAQTRVACEDHTGLCEYTAWNFKIYYTKYCKCCYNSEGQFTHKGVTGTGGPTTAVEGDCCQDLSSVTFDDGQWALPCQPSQPIPD